MQMQQMDVMMMGDGPGRRLRKNVANVRRHVDYVATVLNHAEVSSSPSPVYLSFIGI